MRLSGMQLSGQPVVVSNGCTQQSTQSTRRQRFFVKKCSTYSKEMRGENTAFNKN